jgi:hypothetical protein
LGLANTNPPGDIYAAIEARHGFAIPPAYRALTAAGRFDPFGRPDAQALDGAGRVALLTARAKAGQYLYLPQVEWYGPQELFEFTPGGYWPSGLMPFAGNGAGDQWGWYTPWAAGEAVPVVFCDHERWEGTGVAPDFSAALLRLVLDSFSDFSDAEFPVDALGPLLHTYGDVLRPYLSEADVALLTTLSARPTVQNADGNRALLTAEEATALGTTHLAFSHLGQTFRWAPP